MRNLLLFALLMVSAIPFSFAQNLDNSFQSPVPLRKADVYVFKSQPDGKILIGGEINFFGAIPVNHLVRLMADGTRDNTFSYVGDINYKVQFIELQSNGNIVVCSRQSLRILSAVGDLLHTIDVPLNEGYIMDIAVQDNDKILMTAWRYGTGHSNVIRYSASGVEDQTFNTVETDGSISDIAFQGTKVLIAGSFSKVNDVSKKSIARLDADGNLDASFDTGSGTNDGVNSIAVQSDGKILPALSAINTFNGEPFHGMVRLNPDGDIDHSFDGPYPLAGRTSLIKFNGSKIIVCFYYNSAERLVQLNSDGSIDPSFTERQLSTLEPNIEVTSDGIILGNNMDAEKPFGVSKYSFTGTKQITFGPELSRYGIINQIDFAKDKKIIVGGDFIRINGVETNNVARLFSNGTVDPSFVVPVNNDYVFCLKVLPDNRVLVSSENDMFKLEENGQISSDFNFSHFKELYEVVKFYVQPDQHIVAGGPNNIYRLMPDGSEDTSFDVGLGSTGANGTAFDMDVQADGKILYGGIFDGFNGTPANKMVRLNSDATVDPSFNVGTGPSGSINAIDVVSILNNNEIAVGGWFTSFDGVPVAHNFVKLSANGKIDQQFNNNLSPSTPYYPQYIKPFWNKIIIADRSSSLQVIENDGTLYEDFKLPQEILGIGRIDNVTTKAKDTVFVTGLIQYRNTSTPVFMSRLVYEPRPVITAVSTPRVKINSSFDITIDKVTATDAWQTFPQGFSVSIGSGTHYAVQGSSVIPAKDYSGLITVPVTIHNSVVESLPFNVQVMVYPNQVPVITSTRSIQMTEDTPYELKLSDVVVTDIDNSYPADFSLHIASGSHYTVNGSMIAPEANYNGPIDVTIKVNDGDADSAPYICHIVIAPVNDAPVITGLHSIQMTEDTPYEMKLADLIVTDIDNSFPTGFSLQLSSGVHYTLTGNVITPELNYSGPLTIPVIVNDGTANSTPFSCQLTVTPVNDAPVILAVKNNLTVQASSPLSLALTDITVTDPDNTFPGDFSFSFVPGTGYSIENSQLIVRENIAKTITAAITVSDGKASSQPFSFNVFVTPITGIEDISSNKIAYYPNPTAGLLTLVPAFREYPVSITLTNMAGAVVYETLIYEDANTIDITHLLSGIYLLDIHNGNNRVRAKIVKQ